MNENTNVCCEDTSNALDLATVRLAKTGSPNETGNKTCLGLPLKTHLMDCAKVITFLYESYLSPHVKKLLEGNSNNEQTLAFLRFVAAFHDAGKDLPDFQNQLHQRFGFEQESTDKKRLSHSKESDMIFRICSEQPSNAIASLLNGHHRKPTLTQPTITDIRKLKYACSEAGSEWADYEQEWLRYYQNAIKFSDWDENSLPNLEALCIEAGLLILADWIASDPEYFPYLTAAQMIADKQRNREEPIWKDDVKRGADLEHQIRLGGQWDPQPEETCQEYYQKRFGEKFIPHLEQKLAYEAAQCMDKPGLMIIEAEMGKGKTEMGLAAAEIFAKKFGMNGLFFGLPTQATSNGLFRRVSSWFEQQRSCNFSKPLTMNLVHQKAKYNPDFLKAKRLSEDGEELSVLVDSWYERRHMEMFPNFVIGTYDHLLMMALQNRNVFFYHLALANKVVIVDEVHSLDEYSLQYLKIALRYLGSYQVPVILLSASLGNSYRRELIKAYQDSWYKSKKRRNCAYKKEYFSIMETEEKNFTENSHTSLSLPEKMTLESVDAGKRARNPKFMDQIHFIHDFSGENEESLLNNSRNIPLISWTQHTNVWYLSAPMEGKLEKEIALISIREDEAITKIGDFLADGAVIGVVVNTVKKAQELYEKLSATYRSDTGNADVFLLHSRFTNLDRSCKEKMLEKLAGKNRIKQVRPQIVIGTQVLEESLDLDFDVLFSQSCKVESFIQRTGRLFRHVRPRPDGISGPVCYVITEEITPESNVKPYQAWDVYRMQQTMPKSFFVPSGVSAWIKEVELYRSDEQWEAGKRQAENEKNSNSNSALPGLIKVLYPRKQPDLYGFLKNESLDFPVRLGIIPIECLLLFTDGNTIWFNPESRQGISAERTPDSGQLPALIDNSIRLPESLMRYKSSLEKIFKDNRQRFEKWTEFLEKHHLNVLWLDLEGKYENDKLHFAYNKDEGFLYSWNFDLK